MRLPSTLRVPEPVLGIARTLEAAGHETWCVGGALRDALLGDPATDFDLATAARPEEVVRLFKRTVPVGIRFGTVGVLDGRGTLHEVTTFRRDVRTDGRHAEVEFGASLEDDLARRDFTINALAWHPLRQQWCDPFGGAADLAARVVRAVGAPAARFREDYLRILRALRFAARFDFSIDTATWDAAREAAPGLAGLSAERVRDEWFKGLRTARSVARFASLWDEVGAAGPWLPGLRVSAAPRSLPAGERDPVLLSVLLLPEAATVLHRLRASNAEVERAERMVRGPAAPLSSEPAAVRRWMASVAGAAEDLIALAGLREGIAPPWAEVVAGIRARGEAVSRAELALSGADLRAAGVPPGPEMGRLLDALLDAVLDDPALNTKAGLLARLPPQA